jgi:hypothetical protein
MDDIAPLHGQWRRLRDAGARRLLGVDPPGSAGPNRRFAACGERPSLRGTRRGRDWDRDSDSDSEDGPDGGSGRARRFAAARPRRLARIAVSSRTGSSLCAPPRPLALRARASVGAGRARRDRDLDNDSDSDSDSGSDSGRGGGVGTRSLSLPGAGSAAAARRAREGAGRTRDAGGEGFFQCQWAGDQWAGEPMDRDSLRVGPLREGGEDEAQADNPRPREAGAGRHPDSDLSRDSSESRGDAAPLGMASHASASRLRWADSDTARLRWTDSDTTRLRWADSDTTRRQWAESESSGSGVEIIVASAFPGRKFQSYHPAAAG